MPTIESRLARLRRRWEELRQQGNVLSAEELCRDCPELIEPFRIWIEGLGRTGRSPAFVFDDEPARARSPVVATAVSLTVSEGPHQGSAFTFHDHDTFIVGRSPQAHFRLPLKDKSFSRFHFLIEVNPPHCRIMDMASTNGTFVNGRRVHGIDLKDGDVIKGGRTVLVVTVVGSDRARAERGPGDEPTRTFSPVPDPAPAPEGTPAAAMIPRYRIERELGRGGMGVVFLARSEADGALVALKTIARTMSDSPTAVERFLREASLLRRLDHPNIVRFREIGRAPGQFYIAMDYVAGPDASSLLSRTGAPLPIGRAVALACQLLDGLSYAHAMGVVHRDIKPNNVLIAREGDRDRVLLADFGLARVYQSSPLSGLTLTGQVAGTSGFVAPEQIANFRESKPAADLYSAGATLYYLLTRQKVYDFPPGFQQQLLMILQDDPVPIRARRQDVPEELAAIVARSLSRDPAARFPHAAAMKAALRPFAEPR